MSNTVRRLAAVALAAGLVLPTVASAQATPPSASAKGGFGIGAGMNALDKTLAKVDATPDQKAKIKSIVFDAFMSLGAQAPAFKATAASFGASLMAPRVDRAALETDRVAAVADFDAFSKVLVKAIGDAAEVLTAEQRAKLATSAKAKS